MRELRPARAGYGVSVHGDRGWVAPRPCDGRARCHVVVPSVLADTADTEVTHATQDGLYGEKLACGVPHQRARA
jgi:hypothetical protein